MKQAAMPPCLGGGESGTNVAYWVDHNLTICVMANRPVEVRILPSQLRNPKINFVKFLNEDAFLQSFRYTVR